VPHLHRIDDIALASSQRQTTTGQRWLSKNRLCRLSS
jgi:hypothetical protein